MRKNQVRGRTIILLPNEACDCRIRKMAVPTHQSLFQIPRIWADAKHVQVVIGFENENVRTSQVRRDILRQVTDIRELRYPNTAARNTEGHRLDRIVRNPERRDLYVADLKRKACGNWNHFGSVQFVFV